MRTALDRDPCMVSMAGRALLLLATTITSLLSCVTHTHNQANHTTSSNRQCHTSTSCPVGSLLQCFTCHSTLGATTTSASPATTQQLSMPPQYPDPSNASCPAAVGSSAPITRKSRGPKYLLPSFKAFSLAQPSRICQACMSHIPETPLGSASNTTWSTLS